MKKFYDAVYWMFMSSCKLLFITSIGITSYVVFCRYLLHKTPRWGEQSILLCMVYMAFISASLAIRTDTHLKVVLVDFLLPKKAVDALKCFGQMMIFGFSLFMVVYGIQFCSLMTKSVMSGIPVPQAVEYAAVPLAGICMLLLQSERLILFFLKRSNKVPQAYLDAWAAAAAKEDVGNALENAAARKSEKLGSRENGGGKNA